jgi:hypothetical protein
LACIMMIMIWIIHPFWFHHRYNHMRIRNIINAWNTTGTNQRYNIVKYTPLPGWFCCRICSSPPRSLGAWLSWTEGWHGRGRPCRIACMPNIFLNDHYNSNCSSKIDQFSL